MKKGAYLFLIVAAAFMVRAVGMNYGLPFIYHDDEPIVVNYALAYGAGDFNPHVFNITPLLTYILFFLYGIFFVIGRIFGYFHTLADFAYLYINNPTIFYIIGRSFCGLFCGTTSVILAYLVGKKYFNTVTGLLSALFLAFDFLHVRDSHYIYFDIPLTLCVLLFFLKAYNFFTPHPRKKDYIQIGALTGLAISVKYQGVSLLLPLLIIILYDLYLSKGIKWLNKLFNLVSCAVSMLAVVFVANPFLFMNLSKFITKAQRFAYLAVPPLYHLKISLVNGCGTPMVLFGIIGIVLAMIRRHKSILIAAYVIFYYLLIIKITQPGERLVLPIVPLILIFSAFAVISIWDNIKNRPYSITAIFCLTILLLYPSLMCIYYSDTLFLREDTRTQAYRWIKDNIKPGSRIALDATSSGFPRIEKDKGQIKELVNYFGKTSFGKPANADQAKLKFMLENPFYPDKAYYLFYLRNFTKRGFLSIYPCINVQFKEVEDKNADYIVLSNILNDGEYGNFVKETEAHSVLIKTFSPYRDSVLRIKSAEVASVPAAAFMERELLDRESYGPYIKIYKVKR